MSKHLQESLQQLKAAQKAFNQTLANAEKAINISMGAAMKNVNSEDAKKIQSQVIELKKLLNRATKGENIDDEVKEFSKQFEQKDK